MKFYSLKYIFTSLALFVSFYTSAQSSKYKCMLQMSNYQGEGAYVVVSLIDPQGQYEKTLYVMGPDKKWYNTLKEWYKVQSKKSEKLDAITGASVSGGARSLTTFVLDETKMDKGYKLRFETAVENQKYHVNDIEIPLTKTGITQKTEGKGYIRYVKLNKVE